MVPHATCLFVAARTRKKQNKLPRLVLVRARPAAKLLLRYSTGKIKSNPREPHFETLATMSQSVEGAKTAVAFATLQ